MDEFQKFVRQQGKGIFIKFKLGSIVFKFEHMFKSEVYSL